MFKNIILLVTIVCFISCNEDKKMPENFDYGTIENGIYTNDYFKFRLDFDESWNIQTQEQMNETAQYGAELITNDNVKAAIKATEVNTANLFSAYRHPLEQSIEYNYSIVVLAENTKMYPRVKRGSDYLDEARKLMSQTVVDYEFEDNYTTRTIGDQTFDVMTVTGDYMGISFRQEYMTTIINGFSFSIILSYDTDQQRQSLQNLIDKMSFNASKSKKKS
nr:hypothetical protein [uncultured Psychroserpens sp.]